MEEKSPKSLSFITQVFEKKTEQLNLDCVSFCKIPGYENLLLAAKYEQDQKTFEHSGGIIMYDTKEKLDTMSIS
jgi:hypothetical protein